MEIYGIKNITEKELELDYDKYYKEIAIKLKNILDEDERNACRSMYRQSLSNKLNVQVDLEVFKEHFLNLLLDKNSSKLLWILYSKYENEENYIDKLSSVLKRENKIIRGGTNTYKMNGWMTHTLYVYQIANYNIPNNIELANFNGNIENKKQIENLNKIYLELTQESKFVLKIFCLIHDIGVIKNIVTHDKAGAEYVDEVLKELYITDEKLKNINIGLNDFSKIMKTLITYHTLISALSTEGSDKFVENTYKDLINEIPDISNVKNQIPEILFLMGYGDITGVDEVLMNKEKYERTKECYEFFKGITENKSYVRDKEKVAIERICDTVGYIKYEELKNSIDEILKELNIEKQSFIENMFNIYHMTYTGPLMKTLKDVKLTIKIYNEIFSLITELENRKSLEKYTITFIPDVHEKEFVKEFQKGTFFECINRMKISKEKSFKYERVQIKINNDTLSVKIIN